MPYDANTYLLNHVNIALSRKLLNMRIRFSRKLFRLLQLLHRLGCIKNFVVFRQKYMYVKFTLFFYKSRSFYKSTRIISTPSKKFYITIKALKRLTTCTKSSIFILSTTKGLITHTDALKYNMGGLMIAALS